jgi:acetyl-CoA carboxylase biotin carboxyl carrier protein
MNLDDIKEILGLVKEHELSEFEYERDGLRLRVKKAGQEVVYAPAPVAAPAPAPAPLAAAAPAGSTGSGSAAAAPAPDAVIGTDLAVIKAPLVGTFYAASEPGARPFANVGDAVKKDQVLCIIEAMKLMNEIKADADGEVVAVYVKNGQAVQFGERLFAIKVS